MVTEPTRMPISFRACETDTFAMKLLELLRELGVEAVDTPDQEAVDTTTAWAKIEDTGDISEAQRSDVDDFIRTEEENSVEDSNGYGSHQRPGCT